MFPGNIARAITDAGLRKPYQVNDKVLNYYVAVHPLSMRRPYALLKFMARPRLPYGTQKIPLTAASFRT